jgi:hypothetical protein
MRQSLAFWACVAAAMALAAACGARTGIGDVSGQVSSGGAGTSSSTSSTGGHPGCGTCPAAITCASKGFDCGVVGDGCGCTLDCGVCSLPEQTCGNGTTPNVCVTGCKPTTCAALGFDCGLTGDGCDGTIDCGTCPGGKECGASQANLCGLGNCKTCVAQGFECGQQDDGCGDLLDCGTCPAGTLCGSGSPGKNGVCGAPSCTPLGCAQQSFNCGKATDKCGGIINCGTCAGNQICGKNSPNVCGMNGACTGLCQQQVTCPGIGTTSVSGTVFAPQGTDPLFGALVYVPNGPVQPFTPGVACGDCSAQVTGAPLVSAVTGADGTFTITNMPVGPNIPLVIQNGRWRRQFTIPNVPACVDTPLPTSGPGQIRMPRTKAEGDIPLMGFVTGFADTLECVLRKIGIDDSEFSDPSGNGRVRFYHGVTGGGVNYSAATPGEDQLWTTQAAINQYDLVYFACQGSAGTPPDAAKSILVDYANAGGRIFTTHYSYVWLFNNGPFATTAMWNVNQMMPFATDPGTGLIDMTFPEGLALAQWLKVLYPATTLGQIPISTLRHDFDGVVPPSRLWIHVDDPNFPMPVPMHYTFDTPVGVPPAQQCGRVLYDDFHVENATMKGLTFPQECNPGPMTPQEKMLEFMIFDLGACVHLDVCNNAKTCAQQSVQCGPAGDGCGNILQCGACPSTELCVGGTCTTGCTPRTCAQQGFACGAQDDTCGSVLQCGACPPNQVCVFGQCKTGICHPKTCQEQGFTCGPQGDGCGNLVQCGTCAAGQVCASGTCQTPPCAPKTCADLGFDCGQASDGCNHVIDCGSCTLPAVCGGAAGKPNVCN